MVQKTKLLFILLTLFLASSCYKWNLEKLPQIGKVELVSNTIYQFELNSSIAQDGYSKPKDLQYGFCWSFEPVPDLSDSVYYANNLTENQFSWQKQWTSNATIYVKSFVKNKIGITYSEQFVINFPGTNSNLPTVNTLDVENVSFYSVNAFGILTGDGGLPIIEKGFEISTSSNFSNPLVFLNSDGTFINNIEGLNHNTDYYIRAFAKNIAGVGYGPSKTFQTRKFYQIGEQGPSGGYIFYTKPDSNGGWNFLEAAPSDYAQTTLWSNSNSNISTSVAIGNGLENTSNITALTGSNLNAANACQNFQFTSNGTIFSDWFLPARDELILLKTNLFEQNLANLSTNSYYWSSTQDNNFSYVNAWVVRMSNGQSEVISKPKNTNLLVRPIRRF
ncbi:MAG: DUF1566 domain-containing protein [Bacteroidetes bacterium]|nr:DUF1566 domain-containing protein [Bacteroidota bacterium]